MKKVSIIIPFYNDGKYIKKTIESVIAQTYKNIEVIIIDDGSDDIESIKILHEINFPSLKKMKIAHSGPAIARNKAIDSCSGEFILPLDSDDLIDPTYIEKAVGIIEQDQSIGIVYCLADRFGNAKGIWDLPKFNIGKMLVGNIIFVTSLFRKNDWEEVGGFDETFQDGIEDYDFWLSILEIGRGVYCIPEILFHYRIKKVSRNQKFGSNPELLKKYFAIIQQKHRKLYLDNYSYFCNEVMGALIDEKFKWEKIKYKFRILRHIINMF